MTKREAAIITAYTGYLIGDFNIFHSYAEEKLKRPIFAHEFAYQSIAEELHQKSKKDFINIKVED